MKYYIKIIYDTGDSFHQETNVEGRVRELEWDDLEKAEAALQSIGEHNDWLLKTKQFGRLYYDEKRIESLNAEAKSKNWYCPEGKLEDYQIYVLDDKGNKVIVHTFWTGYFENLVCAEIEENKSKRKYTPKREN